MPLSGAGSCGKWVVAAGKKAALREPSRSLQKGDPKSRATRLVSDGNQTRNRMQKRAYRIVADRGPVKDGATGARYADLAAVCKTNETVYYCVANEYLAERIGRFLGLPIPPGAIIPLGGDPPAFGYACLEFALTGEGLPPVDASDCVAKLPDLSTGLVMFDILIANPDRHVQNLAAVLHEQPYEMTIFDHGHALFGHSKDGAIKRLTDLQDRLAITGGSVTKQNRHCLLDGIDDAVYFAKWISRIETLPNHYIDTTCDDLVGDGIISDHERSAIVAFLRRRRDRFPKLLEDHKAEFRGIKQWVLRL